jgi:hypothetical protein
MENKIEYVGEYEIRGIKYIVNGYYNPNGRETLMDKLVRIESDRVLDELKKRSLKNE